jgi:hypothetical protein
MDKSGDCSRGFCPVNTVHENSHAFTQSGACSGTCDWFVLIHGGTAVLAIMCSASFIVINSKERGSRPRWLVRKFLEENHTGRIILF